MKETATNAGVGPESEGKEGTNVRKRQTLLQKYSIPVERLDFDYVATCTNAKEVERILKILRSGEEGHFPDLEKCVSQRLEILNPKSRVLRVETPILRSECLANKELDELKKTFLNWVDEIELANEKDRCTAAAQEGRSIFTDEFGSQMSFESDLDIPIRQINPQSGISKKGRPSDSDPKASQEKTKMVAEEQSGSLQAPTSSRIKSWEYDKWEKFDVDAELTKLDVEEMQQAELDRDKPIDEAKLREEQALVEKLMKNKEVPSYLRQSRTSQDPLHLKKDSKYKKQKSIFSKTSTPPSHFTSNPMNSTQIEMIGQDSVPDLEDVISLANTSQIPITCASSSSVLLDPHPQNSSGHSSTLQSFLSSATNPLKQQHQQKQQWRDPSRKSFIEELLGSADEPSQPVSEKYAGKNNVTKITENSKAKVEEKTKTKRRFKIHIDDLNLG